MNIDMFDSNNLLNIKNAQKNDFALFWKKYPRKVGKKAAERAWKKLSIFERDQATDAIDKHVALWVHKKVDVTFIPHPATWLNAGRWDDELEQIKSASPAVRESWWTTWQGIVEQGKALGLVYSESEPFPFFKQRVFVASGHGPWNVGG